MTPTDEVFRQAVTAHQAGDLDAAERLYRELLVAEPHHAGVLTNLGVLVANRGDAAEAHRLYSAALAANPNHLDARFNLGNLYRRLNRPADAAAAFQAVLRISPNHPRAFLNLGLALSDAGDWDAAINSFRRAVAADPGLAEAYNLLGDALFRTGRVAEAAGMFREYIARCPDDPRGHHNLGLTFAATGDPAPAIAALEQALRLRPDYPDAHNSLGVALEAVQRADDAQAHYQEAVRLRPDFADAWSNLGTSFAEQGRVAEAIDALRQAMAIRPDPRTGSNLLLALTYSSDADADQLRDDHATWAATFADPKTPAEPMRYPAPPAGRRLKVGYVSGDFRAHTSATFIESLLTHHDRNAVHVTCYPNVARPDATTARLKRLADTWRSIHTLADGPAADAVRDDEIDILVDLSGHTGGNRLLVFARRPAPVQLTLYGYPCAPGPRAIDSRVTDPFADPPDAPNPEPLTRLPEIAWVYAPPPAAPEPNPLPAANRRAFTFGSLNNPAKLSDACVVAWARVLKAVPGSRLVLMAGRSVAAANLLAERFAGLGIVPDRLEIVHRLQPNEYFEAYQPIDLCLDPFPYNGGSTTCDALWMGVPVLTVAGRDARSRQGVSILNNVGLPEFVAESPEKLVDLATTWADQRDGLADLRGSLREMMRQSPVTDAVRFVRHLEAAYKKLI